MLGKKMVPFKKLAKKVRGVGGLVDPDPAYHEYLLKKNSCDEEEEESTTTNNAITTTAAASAATPTGFFALYIGEERQRYVVPTSYLSHPLFKMLLEKTYNEFGFDQRNGLVVPCSVSTFQEVVSVIECNNGKFDLGKVFAEFV